MFTLADSYKSIIEADTPIREAMPFLASNYDFSCQSCYEKPFSEYEGEELAKKKSILKGLNHLLKQAEGGKWFYRIYSEEECAEDPKKNSARLFRMASEDPEASGRPFAVIVPGGGYSSVWNVIEGFPVACELNRRGYHCFILSYRVQGPALLPKPLEDYAAALQLIREKAREFRVDPDRYFTTGFSAGANLIGLWGTKLHGYLRYGMPKPICMFPVYAPVSWKLCFEKGKLDWFSMEALGLPLAESSVSCWNIDEQTEDYPPCYIAATEEDSVVDPEHSRLLYRALKERGISAVLEMGTTGEHGFGDGSGTSMEGWIGRAVEFMETVEK